MRSFLVKNYGIVKSKMAAKLTSPKQRNNDFYELHSMFKQFSRSILGYIEGHVRLYPAPAV